MSANPPNHSAARPVSSIRVRLATALMAWAVFWGVAVGAAVWVVVEGEVDELLDDALQSSAGLLAAVALNAHAGVAMTNPQRSVEPAGAVPPVADGALQRFAWQVVAIDGTVTLRSLRAPATPWLATPTLGFSDTAEWHLFGLALAADGRMLYAAQTRVERQEAKAETAFGALLAALAVGLIGHVWLRSRVRCELEPLQTLSDRLRRLDFDAAGAMSLGLAERRELQPVHQTLDELMVRLAARVANERAFSAHAAHALRTPLAGIDAQLAVVLRDCPPALDLRLRRVREAAGRLQGVVAALLSLFRTGSRIQRARVDVSDLLSRLPAAGLKVNVAPDMQLDVDADLLAAALLNLLDNSLRHGAHQVEVALTGTGALRFSDDGPGVPVEQRLKLQAAVDAEAYDDATGLGLMLADRVARAHGGRLQLLDTEHGFAVQLDLSPTAVD